MRILNFFWPYCESKIFSILFVLFAIDMFSFDLFCCMAWLPTVWFVNDRLSRNPDIIIFIFKKLLIIDWPHRIYWYWWEYGDSFVTAEKRFHLYQSFKKQISKAWLATYFDLPHPQLPNPKAFRNRNCRQLAFLMVQLAIATLLYIST